jgi:soluble lytic murein transglycosylase
VARTLVAVISLLLIIVPATARATPAAEILGRAYRAYDRGDLIEARREVSRITESEIINRDYLLWLRGQLLLLEGNGDHAQREFAQLARMKDSRFAAIAPWRLADGLWLAGKKAAAVKQYQRLLAGPSGEAHTDLAVVHFRVATAGATPDPGKLRQLRNEFPAHPLAAEADALLRRLLGEGGAAISAADRLMRAASLTRDHLWHEAVAELAAIPDDEPADLIRRRDYWLGTTLFKMRRRYADASRLLLSVYSRMGAAAAEAMFHGARALSRADRDDEAVSWYQKVVAKFPRSPWAEEAQYLSGWLEFNRGRYAQAIAPLEESLRRYPRSKWVDDALWFLGMSHYLQGQWDQAQARLEQLARRGGALEGGKGSYWLARTMEQQGDVAAADSLYRRLVERFPMSWYALLARSQLSRQGIDLDPFGGRSGASGLPLADEVPAAVFADPLMVRIDELLAAGLEVDAGLELERGQSAFIRRIGRATAISALVLRYRRAGNFHRPWMLSFSHHGGALDGPATGNARRWWQHAYPLAYQGLVEKYQALGSNPAYYLYAIMRKESGFDPHVLSYADAQGLLQMIPATTLRVARALDLDYRPGRLYEPEFNIQTGSWYIGKMLQKFKGQIPIGAGSFNSGPRPVMRWLETHGHRPIDEFVELVPYTQTREYMKKVTENHARYVYLYTGTIYVQPLTVDADYLKNDLVY